MSEIEAVYGLSPMQGGILFHDVYEPHSDAYFCQAHWSVCGELDVPAFRDAWQHVLNRHSALRASFDAAHPDGPAQLIHRAATVPFTEEDWRGLPERERAERLDSFLLADRARGFDLAVAPLLRVAVLRQTEDEWRVVWSAHHLLVDGRAVTLVIREVFALYEARVAGKQASLPDPVPYKEFIAWQEAQDRAAAEIVWREALKGFTGPTSFGGPRGDHRGEGATARLTLLLPPEAERAVRALAGATETTLNTVIMGAWAILLGRYSGRDDVAFGLTVGSGGEGAPLGRGMVGLVINTVPLRIRVAPEERVAPFLRTVRGRLLEARRFASTPLVDIARWSEIPAAAQLFDTLLSFDNSSLDRLGAHRGTLRVGPPEIVQGAGYGLNLIVRRGAALRLDFLYRTDSIGEASVARLAAQLERLLVEMAAGRHTRLDDLSALPEEERREVTVAWNATDAPYPQDACLHELFDAQARRTPDALAVADGRRRLTYGELDRRAGNLARRLRARGVGPEVIVGLALERSADLVAGMLGIAKAGSAFLLLDPRNPPDRTAFMLADSGARLVVTRGPRPASLPEHVEAVPVDADGDGAGEALEGVPLTPSSLAYVVYTSGTTGTPRGVMVEARGLMNLIAWHARAFGISPQDRATQIAGPGFDAAVWEIWPYLASGSSIHIPPEEVRGMPARLRDWLLGESITITFLPTPLAEAMLSLDWPPAAPLRTVLVGGDVLHASPRPGLPFAVVNNYGPSECTVVATSGAALPGGGPPSIGRPIANTQVYLLDERRRPVPVGVTAEISIGGAGVARGYLNRPDLTAERFLPHPFTPGERIYRTGDLARHRPNGELEFVGRADRQITLRGYRIEPDEIEAALRRQPGVREAAAVVRDGEQGERLVAYVVPTAEGDIDVPALRRALRATLPDYMVPAAFVPLASLPLTPNGKIDRAALPAPRWMGMEAGGRRTAPHSATERALASLWSDVLGVESVGVHDSFFDLGGDSLLSIRLVEGIRARLGVDLGVSDLFRAPTPAGLAGVIERPVLPAPVDTLVPIRPLGSRLPFFCAAPVLGTVFPYYELAHLLPDDQPFYGLQPAGLSPGEAFTVEALAGRYIEAVCAVQARGPYRLGGWSFGGLVAFEMAQQLRRAGHEVALLAVLDTPAPAPHRGNQLGRAFAFLASTVTRGLWGYAQDYGYLAVIAAPRPASCVRPLLQTARRPLARRASIAEVVARESRLARYRLPTIREMARSFGGGLLAALRYRPEGYAGEITLIRTGEPALDGEDGGSFGWDELAPGGVRLYRVPGNHMTLLRHPHLPAVAAALREALDRAG